MPDTLVIGVGAAGHAVCRRLAERLTPLPSWWPRPAPGEGAAPPQADEEGRSLLELLLLDTDRTILPPAEDGGREPDNPPAAPTSGVPQRTLILTTSLAVLDAAYRSPERFHAEWMDLEVLHNRPSTEMGTRGSRMLGRFLLLLPENQATVREQVRGWLERSSAPRRVYLVASIAGGTGGGMVVDLGYLVRQTAAALGVEVEVRAILFVPPASAARQSRVEAAKAANAFAALTELHYFSDPCTRYRAHLGEGETPFQTRVPPYHRVSLLTSLTAEGETIPLQELQERAAIYLLTATGGDDGNWREEQAEREQAVEPLDADGNPQVFHTFGTEWVEYPEERLITAVYRNMVRRSLGSWLYGDRPAHVNDLPQNVPLRDPEAMARLVMETGPEALEPLLRPVRTRVPWIYKAPPSQWTVMDQEFEALVTEAGGTPPEDGRPGKGPVADRARSVRDRALTDLRRQAQAWLSRESQPLDRVSRVLNEAGLELRTATDPVGEWEAARNAFGLAKRRVLWAASAVRKDPFLLFRRTAASRQLALEYERLAPGYAANALRLAAVPYLREVRTQVMEPLQSWAARIVEITGLFARQYRAWADQESGLLERLRAEEEDGRMALGLMKLPGTETPYVATTGWNLGWNLPYCRPEEEAAAIEDLRLGWVRDLVESENGLLALPGRSFLDGGPFRMHEAMARLDELQRRRVDDRLRGWLSATAFQRLAERHRSAVELEFQLRRLVGGAAELPALDPPHARPGGFPMEYELIFFGEAKAEELPSALRMVVDGADRERPTRVAPARSAHYLTAITEHAGFALSRCPAYHHLGTAYQERPPAPDGRPSNPFSRIDVPWQSATLVTRQRLHDASDVLFLATALGVLPPGGQGGIPLPPGVLPPEEGERRFPLPPVFDMAARQLAGDTRALQAVSLAVDRMVQSRGVEWCALQLDRALSAPVPGGVDGDGLRFPGEGPVEQARSARLAGIRAAGRYEELLEEFAGTPTARETEWLRFGEHYACPACGRDLGQDKETLPGACPVCREMLLPHKQVVVSADGFRRIPNPYVVGTPLESGSGVFMGRDDIIQTVQDRLIRPAQRTILILIGERRSGKTSALRQLQYRLKGDLTPIFVDMQGLTASDLPGFVWWLAWRMKEVLDDRGIEIALPSFAEFSSGPADYQFESIILPEIRRKLNGGRVLLMLDEFEVLAQRVMKGTFDSRAFDYLRHLMQHAEGIEFLFAGTHVLRQFAANYVTFLFNIGVFLDVDFLRREDALRLIQEPVAAAGVTYTPDALDAVLELAGAHAYFTQVFGFHLVERLNRLRRREVTREDVEASSGPVIAAGGAHLDHLWGQLGDPERLLIAFFVDFCGRGETCREDDMLQSAIKEDPSLRPYLFRTAVEKLVTVGLLRAGQEEVDGRPVRTLSLTAEVYRQWLQTSHPYSRLREEGLAWG
jgi:tubulin-like protein/AAA domain-containing protein